MRPIAALLALSLTAGALPAQAPTLDALIRAEDARGATAADPATLRAGIGAGDATLRRMAVRGLGRWERPDLLDDVAGALDDTDATVRRAAADAVGQAVQRGEGAARARAILLAKLGREPDASVRGQIAENAGRVRIDSADVAATAEALAAQLPLRGAVRGLFFLARQRAARGLVPAAVAARLQQVATTAALPTDVRATAAAARIAAGGATPDELAALRRDASGDVRALAATAAMITDPAPIVRYRAVALAACPALVTATRDPNAHVALAATDALAKCTDDAAAVAVLEASSSPRALVSLAAVAPARARTKLARVAASRDPFARVHAARAARRLADTTTLRRLARDADANVASEAIDGLSALTGHLDDATYVAALRTDAAQQLMSAAKALAGAPTATPALVEALDRMTARRRETERDARMALVEALGAGVPARYARDWDPEIARKAAALTGVRADPAPLPEPPVPTVAQLRGVRGATIEMADGGRVELRLFPMDAPTNTWRFVRLARAGWFDGLTFHRIAPFFVVQGGSPRANEYVGDGPFTRDEVGLENRRGTVGVSTRGRDTGDGQLYFNTVDNVRLDHDYTVFAEVVRGMEVVDRMQEGARIRRVTIH
ncbi:peptidylprolyl isomerase [Roseisolibacter agri]|uniref:peptidylprolyl isomerase n=1 Tax=Roseisolibacter agri TaxID=2014610 RepID=A0AA37VFH2_9BACT|nr:peptidylprolyl isomerase [Roseisolibacter agri]GLC26864.1 hypothetical protein rosag_33770 [Roseisolibacter agri]